MSEVFIWTYSGVLQGPVVLDRAQVEEALQAMNTLRRIFGASLSSSASADAGAAPDTVAGAARTLGDSIDVFQAETGRLRAAARYLFSKCAVRRA